MDDRADSLAEDLDRLNEAAVRLLDPMIDPQLAGQPALQARRLGEALSDCARAGDKVGARGLNYLATLALPHLHKLGSGPAWEGSREPLEAWIGALVAFCAGHLPAEATGQLMTGLQELPEFPPVPDQFVTLIRRRLMQDAELIATLAAQVARQAMPPAAESADEVVDTIAEPPTLDDAIEGGDAGGDDASSLAAAVPASTFLSTGRAPDGGHDAARVAPEVPAQPIPVARDELEMLAQAMEVFAEETGEGLRALPSPDDASRPAARREWLEVETERLRHWLNAAGYVGVTPLVGLVGLAAESLDRWGDADDAQLAPIAERLFWLAEALAAFLRRPDAGQAARLVEGIADDRWPVHLAASAVGQAVQAITCLRIIGSRQVQPRQSAITGADLSLAIPAEADRRVVDNLLRELPPLSSRLSEAIESLAEGRADELAEAQRVAHTLKGSANTVGIRGVASLAHQLEDLLALVSRAPESAGPDTLAVLQEGADCLAEMSEAVAGIGPEPANALTVCQQVADEVARLAAGDLAETDEDEGTESSGAHDEPDMPDVAELADGADEPDVADAADDTGQADEATPSRDVVAVPPAADGTDQATDDRPEPAPPSPAASAPDQDEPLRVSARQLDQMLELAAQASILLAQAQEQLAQLQETRVTFRQGSERLQDLANELDRVVDLRAVSRGRSAPRAASVAGRDFDALELDQYDDLHTVSRRIAESGADSRLIDQQLDRQVAAIGDAIGQLERVQGDLRETVMRARMVPLATIVPRLQRAVRQAARMTGRRVRLTVDGDATAVDAQLLQALIDPLAHLLRNAVDHGIEDEDERVRAGKAPEGRIVLRVEHTGRELHLSCTDDGRGLDEAAVLRRARERGLVDAESRLTSAQVARLVMAPGFSTRDSATQLSGRGIGLDVVHRAVQQMRGAIDLASTPGQGTAVTITLPIALAGLPVLVARTGTHVLALSIRQVEHIVPGAGVLEGPEGEERFVLDDAVVPVRRLDELLGLPRGWFHRDRAIAGHAGSPAAPRSDVALLVRTADGAQVAVLAPELSQTRRVIVRPMPSWLAPLPGVEGACVLGDGSAAAVIDLPALLAGAPAHPVTTGAPIEPALRQPVCLVVDDSVSVRRSMEGFLRDLGFEVDAAGDGVEALARLEQRVPDLAIVDLEMPRMNGVELVTAMRHEERSCEVPIIMITSRASEKHRRLAIDAGVDVFLTKPYTEDELAGHIRRCLERRAWVG